MQQEAWQYRRLGFSLTLSILLFLLCREASKTASLIAIGGSIGMALFGFAALIYAGLLIWLPKSVVATPDRKAEGTPAPIREPYGPHFPTGRYLEMLEYTKNCIRPEVQQKFRLCVEIEGIHAVTLLAEEIYTAMDQAGRDFKDCRESLRSSEALGEAQDYLLLHKTHTALAELYFKATGETPKDLRIFSLPEDNIKRPER